MNDMEKISGIGLTTMCVGAGVAGGIRAFVFSCILAVFGYLYGRQDEEYKNLSVHPAPAPPGGKRA